MSREPADPSEFDQIEQTLDRLLNMNSLEQAEALAGLFQSNPELAVKVSRWLRDIEASAGFLGPETRQPGQRVGAWALIRLLGRGGTWEEE